MALMFTFRRGNAALALAGALCLLGSALYGTAALAQAQAPRPDAGTFQRLQKESARPYAPDPDKRSATPGSAPSDATAAVEATAARVIPVSRFVFVGNTRVSSEELAAVLREFTGKVLSIRDLNAAADLDAGSHRDRHRAAAACKPLIHTLPVARRC